MNPSQTVQLSKLPEHENQMHHQFLNLNQKQSDLYLWAQSNPLNVDLANQNVNLLPNGNPNLLQKGGLIKSECINQLASPAPTSAHPDSAYGQSPAMKWAAPSNDFMIPNVMQDEQFENDSWKFQQVYPQKVFTSPPSSFTFDNVNHVNNSIVNQSSFLMTPTLDQNAPLLTNQVLVDIVRKEEQVVVAAAPWQVWDQSDHDYSPTPATTPTAFSLFSPTLPFSVFDNPLSSQIQTTQDLNQTAAVMNQSSRSKVFISPIDTQLQKHHQQQYQLQSTLYTADSTTHGGEDSRFSFMFSNQSSDHTQSPLESDESFYSLQIQRQRERQKSSILSPLTIQFSNTLSSLKSPGGIQDSAVSSPITTSCFFESSGTNNNNIASLPVIIKPVKATVSKKSRKEKDGKETKCFPCEMCCSTFSRNHDLKRHIRIHLGIRPYKCETCPKSFTRMDALNRHKNVRGCKGAIEASGYDFED